MTRTIGLRHRLAVTLAGPLSLLLACAATTTAHAATAEPSAKVGAVGGYAALGDSFASGVGAGRAGGDCRRSSLAHPALWAAGHHPGQFDFAACTGATSADVTAKQLSGLDRGTTLVSITVGGNDVGFADVMRTCTLSSESACLESVARSEKAVDHDLPGKLDAAYRAVKGKAAHARVVVLGYPHLFGRDACLMGPVTVREQSVLNAAADHLNRVTRDRARAHGYVFADVTAAFAGHEICSADPWIHAPSLLTADVAYHPTEEGQREGYLPALTTAAGPGHA
ncbi:SGNH/GDSL hydrolase family protein [Streptomyces violascens]|uniref:SGNH/GDSL hydrolase family protein n=1 Tax=Streptomyces violascens TaxID=67381 RepID=UPI00367BEB35